MEQAFVLKARSRCAALASGTLIAVLLSALSLTAAAQSQEGTFALAATPDATSSPGCTTTGRHSTGVFTWTTGDGTHGYRSFLVQVPVNYDLTKPYSLNFVFHGAGGSSAVSYAWGLQNATGASDNGIFVYPNGIAYKNYGVGWDDTSAGYDMVFFDRMVSIMETWFCIDKSRVFVAGFSWGGDFAVALMCNRGGVIRAVAVNSATDEFADSTNFMTYADLPCAGTARPAVRFEHAIGGDSSYPAPEFATTSSLLRYFNSCSATSTPAISSTSTMACVAYNSCTNETIECPFTASLGHVLPPNWAIDTWAFFSSFESLIASCAPGS